MEPSLVVGWDASPQARAALAAAVRLARGGRVVAVHVREPRHGRPSARWQELAEMDADLRSRALLDEAGSGAVALDGCTLELRSADGAPAGALLDVAEEIGADAVVVGSRGLGDAASLVGSVSATLLRDARLPVLVAPPPTP